MMPKLHKDRNRKCCEKQKRSEQEFCVKLHRTSGNFHVVEREGTCDRSVVSRAEFSNERPEIDFNLGLT